MALSGSPHRRIVPRRAVLRAGIAAAVGDLAAHALPANTRPAEGDSTLERIPLGKTGVKVTRLAMGGSFPEYGPRLLQIAYRAGLRYFDLGDFYAGYKAESRFGKWVKQLGRRDELLVVNKARTTDPKQFVARLHEALEKMQLETVDMFFVHGLKDPDVALDRKGIWRKIKDRLIREKKIRFMGFSTHAPLPERIACLNNAAKSGWVDALMCACDPGMIRSNDELNRALDACAKARIGLVCMKTSRGLGKPENQPAAREAFKPLGLSPHQAMLVGMWSDGRFASVCSEMPNVKILEENTKLARTFRKPFGPDEWKLFDNAAKKLARATCPGCDGICQRAAGVQTDFCSIARFLAYYEEDGKRAMARQLYRQLAPEQRQWRRADLQAAARVCPVGMDFESLRRRAERLLA